MKHAKLMLVALIFLFVAATIPSVHATAYTYIMQGTTHTINETLGYKLLTTNGTTTGSDSTSYADSVSVSHGIRVYTVDEDGDESEVTSGTVVAVMTRTTSGEGIQTATWNCPLTNNAMQEALIVRVYRRFGSGDWSLRATFVSNILNLRLSNSTWTVSLYTRRAYVGGSTYGTVYWGTTTYYSHIENVDLLSYTSWEWMDFYLKSGNFIRFLFTPYVNPMGIFGEIAYGMIVLIPALAIYNRTENISYVAAIFILFGGASGMLTLLIPAMGLNLANILLIVGIAVLFTKLILNLRHR